MSFACRLSLRTCGRPTLVQQFGLIQVRNAQAAFDRYNTIRIFFARQFAVVHPQVIPQTGSIRPRSIRLLEGSICFSVLNSRRSLSDRRVYTGEEGPATTTPPEKSPQSKSELESPLTRPPDPHSHSRNLEHYPRFLRRLAASLPHLHRPTRDDFLKVASGFWQRTLIRFRWLSIRSFRKFNADDISAFVTWFLMSQTLWILVWT